MTGITSDAFTVFIRDSNDTIQLCVWLKRCFDSLVHITISMSKSYYGNSILLFSSVFSMLSDFYVKKKENIFQTESMAGSGSSFDCNMRFNIVNFIFLLLKEHKEGNPYYDLWILNNWIVPYRTQNWKRFAILWQKLQRIGFTYFKNVLNIIMQWIVWKNVWSLKFKGN